jgi:hypothetical protein
MGMNDNPTRGALATLAAMTAILNPRPDRTEVIAYVLGGAVVPAVLLIYLVSNQALAAAFDDVIRFTAARYSSIQGVPFRSMVLKKGLRDGLNDDSC